MKKSNTPLVPTAEEERRLSSSRPGFWRRLERSIRKRRKRLFAWVGFDKEWYLKNYPDVAKAGINPLEHYLSSGKIEGRYKNKKEERNKPKEISRSTSSEIIKRKEAAGSGDSEADCQVAGFHLSTPLNLEVSDELFLRPFINVLLPSLRPKDMSGGPNTALILAVLLAEKGESIRLIATDIPTAGETEELFHHIEGLMQRHVPRERIQIVDGSDRVRPTIIGASDLFFATAWWTAQMAKYAVKKTKQKTIIYLIQDFEPILHEGSTFQARALETYSLPHIPVINTRLLLDHLVREGAGCYADHSFAEKALWFEPALDRDHFFPDPNRFGSNGKKVLLFYARPTYARRNLFELGVVALRKAVASGVFDKDNWEVWAMGEKLDPVALGNDVLITPLPWMSFEEYSKRMRTADLLLSLMLSPHPSYPPLEMAASGKLVVTNSFSVKTAERLRALSPNITAADPTVESIAAALENSAGRINAGLPSYDPSGSVALPADWDESLGGIVTVLLQRIHALRTTPPASDAQLSPGYPSKPKTEYESYRRACLVRRRHESGYQQERGLLSFVTTAYNTNHVFLEELATSIFQQDGGTHFEWLILDNGSTNEDTRRALQELARHPCVRLERVEHNLGIIEGMRFCLERAQGRYILPLDSDDLIEPDCVHVLTRFIKAKDYPPLLYTDEDKLAAGRFGSPYFKPGWDPVLFLNSCYIAHLCAIDREKALQLGLYTDKGAEGCHDWDSFIRFMNAGQSPCHVPEVLYSWRMHKESTSGNISSKSYITDSHRATLQRVLSHRNVPHLKLVSSPLFTHNVDWWYRRRHDVPVSCDSLAIASVRGGKQAVGTLRPLAVIDADSEGSMLQLEQAVSTSQGELVHLCWNGINPDDDEWSWDAAGLLELFADAVMVGGTLHDGTNVLDGPRIFGFGNGCDCPDRGRPLTDPGYSATMFKMRSVSAVSSGHCVVRREFLLKAIPTLLAEKVDIQMLGPWLGALAAESGKRVVFSPFMRAKAIIVPEDMASDNASAHFLSRFWSQLPDARCYSPHLGLTRATAYAPVSDADRDRHLGKLQMQTLPYADWLDRKLQQRTASYPIPEKPSRITCITTVYEGTNMEFFEVLAEAVANQTVKAAEWVIVAHGPITTQNMQYLVSSSAERWGARLIIDSQPLGIMRAMRRGLEAAQGEYIVPLDADDLPTLDAIQILTHSITRFNRPDLIYSDEDGLVGGEPASPYLRSGFDPVLNLDSSYIWHLCAINRERGMALELYTDLCATWCHDWDSVMRVANSNGRIEHIPEVLYHWRQHVGSTTNNAQGDQRSLDSVRHILERHISRTATPKLFYVADWPEYRGARELYIARKPNSLPQFIWIGDVVTGEAGRCNEDAILVITANGIIIKSQQVFVEVARLLELHPQVGVIGGLVEGKDGVVIDSCSVVDNAGRLESPWIGQVSSYGGPYALALKTQSVATSGHAMAFFRISALKQAGVWPLKAQMASEVMELCEQLAENGWVAAFSPLVKAYVGSNFEARKHKNGFRSKSLRRNSALVRYGATRNFRDT